MRQFLVLAFALLAASTLTMGGTGDDGRPGERDRLVVFEAADCAACLRLRADVLRRPNGAISDAHLGLEVIDLDALGTAGHPLRTAIRSLPTLVVMHKGREVARLDGYLGRKQFLQFIHSSAGRGG